MARDLELLLILAQNRGEGMSTVKKWRRSTGEPGPRMREFLRIDGLTEHTYWGLPNLTHSGSFYRGIPSRT